MCGLGKMGVGGYKVLLHDEYGDTTREDLFRGGISGLLFKMGSVVPIEAPTEASSRTGSIDPPCRR
jgi:hypothetical protein